MSQTALEPCISSALLFKQGVFARAVYGSEQELPAQVQTAKTFPPQAYLMSQYVFKSHVDHGVISPMVTEAQKPLSCKDFCVILIINCQRWIKSDFHFSLLCKRITNTANTTVYICYHWFGHLCQKK